MSWIKTKAPNISYREHPTRRHGPGPDRYLAIRYYDAQGKRHMEGLGWTSEGWSVDKAARLLGEIRQNIKTGAGPQSLAERRQALASAREAEARRSMTVAQAAALYQSWARTHKASWQDDQERMTLHVLPILGDTPLARMTLSDIELIKRAAEARGLSPATVRQVLTLIRRLLNWCIERGHHPGPNPAAKLRMPRLDNGRVRFLTREEADALLELAAGYDMDMHDVCLLALYTGMRAGEITNLRWEHVDLSNGVLHIEGKTGRRTGYVTGRLAEMFRRRGPGQGLVFHNRAGRPMANYSHRFDTLARKLGWNDGVGDARHKVVFHTLRHTFASWLVQRGVPLLTVRELTGHKTMAMVMRYAHLAPNQAREAAHSLD